MSGNTDCYQPVERHFGITRQLLATFLDYGNPVGVITKSAMILRDLDLLKALAEQNLVSATLSVTTLDPELARMMEPRAAPPARRLEAIARLAEAGIPTSVNAAPVIPGLNDHELPAILAAAAERGATGAGYILLRLPYAVKELFVDWLDTHYPARRDKVLRAIRSVRGGRLSDPRFGSRMTGEGARAAAIERLFRITCAKHGLNKRRYDLSTAHFRRRPAQQELALG
jgi:DNA repair photolyase